MILTFVLPLIYLGQVTLLLILNSNGYRARSSLYALTFLFSMILHLLQYYCGFEGLSSSSVTHLAPVKDSATFVPPQTGRRWEDLQPSTHRLRPQLL
jgi:hypothetical protein